MEHAALYIGRLRRWTRPFVPRGWLAARRPLPPGVRPGQISRARMDLNAAEPASSWVAWEVSGRRARLSQRERSRRLKSVPTAAD
ncbi:MAG: hypothetical protein P8080_10140 [Gammaproteobacteria bacterium]